MLGNQTICVDLASLIRKTKNSQITKARSANHRYISVVFKSLVEWKHNIKSMLVGISEAIRLILAVWILPSKRKSPARNLHNVAKDLKNEDPRKDPFNQWLAGVIDGDGYFGITKKGYISCEITMETRDLIALENIRQKFGGSLKKKSGAKAYRWRMHHKEGVLRLISAVNGLIRNPIRLHQLSKICNKYTIPLQYASPLSFKNGWFSGMIDSDGSIYYNPLSDQIFISVTQNNKYLLDELQKVYGGTIYPAKSGQAFKYTVFKKAEILNLINHYFSEFPLRTSKHIRCDMILDLYAVKHYRNSPMGSASYQEWFTLKDKWDNYKN